MVPWLTKNLGITDEFVQHWGEVRFAFQEPRLFWLALALGLVGVVLGWWYSRSRGGLAAVVEQSAWLRVLGVLAMIVLFPVLFGFLIYAQPRNLGSAPLPVRIALTVTRTAIFVILVLLLGGPYLALGYVSQDKPLVAFLFDHSQSMQLPAGPFESEAETTKIAQAAGYRAGSDGQLDAEARKALNRISRAKLAQSVVQANTGPLLEPLAKKYDLRYYAFSREAAPLGVNPARPELPEPPTPGGSASHLGDAIQHVLDEAAGRPVAGIVLFSDGENTGGRSPTEAARAAAAVGAPVFTVPPGSAARLHDVAIVDVFTSGLVSVGDAARVAVTLESQGFDKRPVKVQLKEGDKVLDSKDLQLRGTEQQQVELAFKAEKAGAHYLTVHVPPLPEEPEYLRANNTDTAFVRVSDEKLRVLYVEGLPRWDYRFLKNAMRRDHGLAGRSGKEPDLVLEAEWRRQTPAQRAEALPRTLEKLAEYHTIILGDASPKLLDREFVELLAKAVREKGVGLIVAAGPQAMPHAFDDKLLDLLPLRVRPDARGMEAHTARPFRLELTPEGSVHEAMRLYDDPGRNQNTWSHMPPFYWCTAAERAAPGATVLAWNASVEGRYGKQPLVAYHHAGEGQVLLVGTDSTWLWRQNVGDRFFYKFWGQGIRFVARKEKGGKKSWIEVRPTRAQPGERAQVELMAFAADGSPRTETTLPVRVLGGDTADVLELTADPTTKGRYTGTFPLKDVGEYRVLFEPGAGAEPAEARVRVLVSPEELRHPNVNRPALELIAATSAGGRLVELPDLGSIADQLKGEGMKTERHREATLWDNWMVLVLLVLLFGVDVGLRRLTGLS
jgi:hypothetical protein